MPIQINPIDFGALGRLAGGANGIPNLPVPGALGLQALQIGNANRNAALDRRQQDEASFRQQAMQQNQLAQQAMMANQQNQLEQQKLAQQGSQFDQSSAFNNSKLAQDAAAQQQNFGLDAQKVGIAQQNADMDKLKFEMAKTLDLKKDDLQARGAFAAYGLMAIKNAKTPAEAETIRQAIVKEALDKKYISQAEADAGAKMPLSQFQAAQASKLMQYGQADDFHKLMDAQAPAKATNALQSITRADGSVENYSPASPANKTVAQADIMFSEDNRKALEGIINNVPDNFFGGASLKQTVATPTREWIASLVSLGNKKIGDMIDPNEIDKKQLTSFSGINGATEMLAMKVIKQLSGVQYSDRQLEYLKEILPSVGPGSVKSTFTGKAENLFRLYDQIERDRKDLLNHGYSVDTKQDRAEFEQEMRNRFDNIIASDKDYQAKPVNDNGRAKMIAAGGKPEAVDAFIAKKKREQ